MVETPLNATATSVGNLVSNSRFVVPPYQREYAWGIEEVREFWEDIRGGLDAGSYFLGLVILTDEESRKHVVDGQQRLLTITLLANALYHEALRAGRNALADRLKSDFLAAIDYDTDDSRPRVTLTDKRDNATLQSLIATGKTPAASEVPDSEGIADKLVDAYGAISTLLGADLASDPFKRLGIWAEFLTNRVYLAVFVHPDAAAAYRVFEVINTRGKDLTTADLLKNYIISQTAPAHRDDRYHSWQRIARPLSQAGPSALVQYIRHVVTLRAGHVLPRELFDYLAERKVSSKDRRGRPPGVEALMASLGEYLPLYMQMIDPTIDGPAEAEWLKVFEALNDLGVIAVRPLLLATAKTTNPDEGMREVLRLVVRRIVVGNLGTGNVERRLGDAARRVFTDGRWEEALADLGDLNPNREEFIERLSKRSYNKGTLTFIRRSQIQGTVTPESEGTLHLIRPRQAGEWEAFPSDEFAYWGSTVGNTVLAKPERRPKGASTWAGFAQNLLPEVVEGEDFEELSGLTDWDPTALEVRGQQIAERAADVWFG
ncbi:DUF262 domain-containing protein [Knoellia sp. 3-2P3]|uniref:DUF262 domain-containing protein n=1 Tax=unclassified Knoellia TaxID=2618719 RepID=UPI0023DAB1F8|nr:DUF262 domain-containing protein [Knoellia sp. 3-2P3]MDF2093615.1 DUF262 domain-containing protein [Knoellia sp. 3-2P3]